MLYNLRNGKTIDITFEQWLAMTPEDEEYLVAFGHGEETNSIWRGSHLEDTRVEIDDILELPDIPLDERLNDPDFLEE